LGKIAEVDMQNWKKAVVFGTIGAGAMLVISGRRPLGMAFAAAGLAVLAADGQAGRPLPELSAAGLLARPTAWLFGNEAWGLPGEVLALADSAVAVPIYGRAESLNLAAAAAVCLYASAEAQRAALAGPR
jgi:TrmH family RNA methyltransferase